MATQQPVFKFTDTEAAQFSPIRFVSPGSAPSLIVHGDADTAVPIDQGETMYAALTKAGVPASFIRINGAGHRFEGAVPADLERLCRTDVVVRAAPAAARRTRTSQPHNTQTKSRKIHRQARVQVLSE